jgi:hypothetical protein
MGLRVPCAHMSECIPYRDTMRNSVKMSQKGSAKQKKVSYYARRERKRGEGSGVQKTLLFVDL